MVYIFVTAVCRSCSDFIFSIHATANSTIFCIHAVSGSSPQLTLKKGAPGNQV